jgi:hypothetical protein
MDLKKLRSILGWCAVINYGLILLGAIVYLLIDKYIYEFSQLFYPIEEDWFNLVILIGLAIWEILIWVFNIVPYIVLRFITKD